MHTAYLSVFVILICSILPQTTFANDANTGGQAGVVRTLSSPTMGKTALHAGGTFKLSTEMEYLTGKNGKGAVFTINNGDKIPVERDGNPFLYTGDIFCAYGLLDVLDVSFDMPLYFDVTGWGEDIAGAGDLELALKMVCPFQKENAFLSRSWYLGAMFPTGRADRGYFPRHSWFLENESGAKAFTSGVVCINPEVVWTLDFSRISKLAPLQIHLNYGGVVARTSGGSILTASVAIVYTPMPPLSLFVDISGESRIKHYSDHFDLTALNNDPVWLSPGARMELPFGFYAQLTADIGLSDNDNTARTDMNRFNTEYSVKGNPLYGVQLSLGWKGILREGDEDHDGIIDKKDACPRDAEDRDDFSDNDGCPDPDNDGDGFIDEQDRCPDVAGPDGGCPVSDSDNDSIPDNKDARPDSAEDRDGIRDDDGSPDHYSLATADKDNDGIADAKDSCPEVKGVPETGGCPKTKEISREKLILDGVMFQPGNAILTPGSFSALDRIYESLVEWPEVKLEIQGHTDNIGNSMTNLRLSQLRADAVKNYFITRGISPDRLRSVGYGEEFPIADNHSAEGREMNRRVELRRID